MQISEKIAALPIKSTGGTRINHFFHKIRKYKAMKSNKTATNTPIDRTMDLFFKEA